MFFLIDCLNVFQTVSNSLRKVDNEIDNEIDNGKENPPAVTLEGTLRGMEGGHHSQPIEATAWSLLLSIVNSMLLTGPNIY